MARYDFKDYTYSKATSEDGSSVCCGCCYCSKKARWAFYSALLLPLAALIGLVLAILVKALTVPKPYQLESLDNVRQVDFTDEEVLEMSARLAEAISIETVAFGDGNVSLEAMAELKDFIAESYPGVHNSSFVSLEVVANHSLLYTVQGSDPHHDDNPYMLCAHLDVVPAGDRSAWTGSPFGQGIVQEEGKKKYVFGRGAIDDKHNVIGILEALEIMIKRSERPKRTVYIAFGHDEETGGNEGAAELAKVVRSRIDVKNQTLDFVLDEGLFVVDGLFPGVDDPVALIGVVEKGWAVVELSVDDGFEQKHSSMPPRETATGILAKAVARLEENPQPSKFGKM